MSDRLYLTEIDGVRVLQVQREAHLYRMFHEWYCFAMFQDGAAEMSYRGRHLVARRGLVSVIEPGEMHRTVRVAEPATFAVCFAPARLVGSIAHELGYS